MALQTKEDALVLLANVPRQFGHNDQERHDNEIMNGTVKLLAEILYQQLTHHSATGDSHYRSKLDPITKLHIAATCNAIEMILKGCSDKILSENIHRIHDEIAPSLPRLVTILASQNESTVRSVTLSTCVKIMRRVGKYVDNAIIAFACALLLLLEQRVPSDVRVDAACAVASFLDAEEIARRQDLVRVIEDNSSVLISILSTGAMAVQKEHLEDCLGGLVSLARGTSVLRSKLLKRRCVILVIRNLLAHADVVVRAQALDLCKTLLLVGGRKVMTHYAFAENSGLLSNALTKASFAETDMQSKITILLLLEVLIVNKYAIPNQISCIMTTFYAHATAAESADVIAIQAATCYLQASDKAADDTRVLANVVEFTMSPYAKVRAIAFDVLQDVTFWNAHGARVLLEETPLLDNFTYVLRHGSQKDCISAMNVSKQLLFFDESHRLFCEHNGFISCVARMATKETVTNRVVYINAVTIVLDLMSSDGNIRRFTKHSELLPFLVKFANRTSDEDLKKRVIATIIRFSSSLLE